MKIEDLLNEARNAESINDHIGQQGLSMIINHASSYRVVGSDNELSFHCLESNSLWYAVSLNKTFIAEFRFENKSVETGSIPSLLYAYVAPSARGSKILYRFLSFIINQLHIAPILIDYMMSDNLIKSLNNMTTLTKFWFNIDTGERRPYVDMDPKFSNNHDPDYSLENEVSKVGGNEYYPFGDIGDKKKYQWVILIT